MQTALPIPPSPLFSWLNLHSFLNFHSPCCFPLNRIVCLYLIQSIRLDLNIKLCLHSVLTGRVDHPGLVSPSSWILMGMTVVALHYLFHDIRSICVCQDARRSTTGTTKPLRRSETRARSFVESTRLFYAVDRTSGKGAHYTCLSSAGSACKTKGVIASLHFHQPFIADCFAC